MPYFLPAKPFFSHTTQFGFIDCNKIPLQPYFCASKQNFLILFPFLLNGLTSNYYYILLVCNTTLERGVSCMLAIPFLPNNIYESEGSSILFWDTSTMPYTCYLAMRHLDLFDRLVKNVIRYPRRTTRDLNAFLFSLFSRSGSFPTQMILQSWRRPTVTLSIPNVRLHTIVRRFAAKWRPKLWPFWLRTIGKSHLKLLL